MQTFFVDYISLLQQCHNEILEALNGLPSDALDWSPGKDMNSITVLVFHLTGAERYWIGDVAAQNPTPSGRDRDAEFRVHDVGMEVLKNVLGTTWNMRVTRWKSSQSRIWKLRSSRPEMDVNSR